MTVVIACAMNEGNIQPLDQNKLKHWKETHSQGEVFDMILDDGSSSALTPLAKRYFAIRDQYAEVNGYNKQYAHVELKHLFGVTFPYDNPPENRLVRLVDAYGEKEWQLSIKSYTADELRALVSGSEVALSEVSV